MVSRLLFLLISLSFTLHGHSAKGDSLVPQEPDNQVYAELLGKGFYYSFNYQRKLITFENNLSLGGSIGISLFNGMTDVETSRDFLLPIEFNIRKKINKNTISIGYGTTYWKYYINDILIDNTNLSQQPVQPQLKQIKEWFAHLSFDYIRDFNKIFVKTGITPLFFAKTSNSAFTRKSNSQLSFNLGVGLNL